MRDKKSKPYDPAQPIKPPKPLTAEKIHDRAIRYLERYASSSENLRRVLLRGLKRREMRFHDVPDDAPQWVEASVERCLKLRLVDDALYTESKIHSLRRAGKSRFYITQHLQQKGVPQKMIAEQLENDPGNDASAALRFAKKKRLGLHDDADALRKDLAKLLRAGFPYAIARRALETVSNGVMPDDDIIDD